MPDGCFVHYLFCRHRPQIVERVSTTLAGNHGESCGFQGGDQHLLGKAAAMGLDILPALKDRDSHYWRAMSGTGT